MFLHVAWKVLVHFYLFIWNVISICPVAANGAEARWGAPSSHTVWNYSRKLAGKPDPEGVSESLLPGPAGHTLPGCWTGWKHTLNGFMMNEANGYRGKELENVNVFLLQVKSVKPCLKQLQQCIQTISTLQDDEILPTNPADLFHWLPKEHMCVLVYLVMLIFIWKLLLVILLQVSSLVFFTPGFLLDMLQIQKYKLVFD